MKSTGIVRKVDQLGRIVIPIELRNNLKIDVKDPLQIFVEEDRIILKKYEPGCIFCNDIKGLIEINKKKVCKKCKKEIATKF